MRRPLKDSIPLTTVESFMAAAAYESYAEAGSQLGVSPTTVMRQIRALELWLRRVLIYTEEVFCTEWGNDFVLVAEKILSLIDRGGLRSELSKTRVFPDGVVTIEGHPISTASTLEIGRLMVQSRADVISPMPK